MHGLVSLLPEPYYARVKNIWQELETRFGLKGIQTTPYPHFSWQIGEDYATQLLDEAAHEVSLITPPLQITTTGVGIFTGPNPVIYIPVVKTPTLANAHAHIWQRFQNVGQDISPYYSPDLWMPHISLAYEDVTTENIGEVMQWLAFQDFSWEMTIDNISYICEPAGEIGALQCTYSFCGE